MSKTRGILQTNTAGVVSRDRSSVGPRPDGGGDGGRELDGDYLVPVGAIVMWAGLLSALPRGWALCDGTLGTPDLTARFILATATEAEIGDTGGTAQHKHAVGTLAGTSDAHTTGTLLVAAGATAYHNGPATHAVTITGKTADAEDGGGSTADVRPPWFKLAFIQKL